MNADGVVLVGGTRVTLDTVIAYYLRATDEVEAYLQKRVQKSEEVRRENERRFDPHGIRDRLMAHRAKQEMKIWIKIM